MYVGGNLNLRAREPRFNKLYRIFNNAQQLENYKEVDNTSTCNIY